LIQAIDAAKADNPAPTRSVPDHTPPQRDNVQPASRPVATAASARATQSATRIVEQGRGVRHGASRFRDLALKPFVRLSGVVVLEVVGVFFGVFAVYGFNTMWRVHASWHAGSPNHRQFLGGALILALFGYFCVTSFVRARRRERGR
jgi:hypothetical protein